jgi:hypothetical protein
MNWQSKLNRVIAVSLARSGQRKLIESKVIVDVLMA